jgi:hypothetical protein
MTAAPASVKVITRGADSARRAAASPGALGPGVGLEPGRFDEKRRLAGLQDEQHENQPDDYEDRKPDEYDSEHGAKNYHDAAQPLGEGTYDGRSAAPGGIADQAASIRPSRTGQRSPTLVEAGSWEAS